MQDRSTPVLRRRAGATGSAGGTCGQSRSRRTPPRPRTALWNELPSSSWGRGTAGSRLTTHRARRPPGRRTLQTGAANYPGCCAASRSTSSVSPIRAASSWMFVSSDSSNSRHRSGNGSRGAARSHLVDLARAFVMHRGIRIDIEPDSDSMSDDPPGAVLPDRRSASGEHGAARRATGAAEPSEQPAGRAVTSTAERRDQVGAFFAAHAERLRRVVRLRVSEGMAARWLVESVTVRGRGSCGFQTC